MQTSKTLTAAERDYICELLRLREKYLSASVLTDEPVPQEVEAVVLLLEKLAKNQILI